MRTDLNSFVRSWIEATAILTEIAGSRSLLANQLNADMYSRPYTSGAIIILLLMLGRVRSGVNGGVIITDGCRSRGQKEVIKESRAPETN